MGLCARSTVDTEGREIQRRGDPVAMLRHAMRRGSCTVEQVTLASRLGFEPAVLLLESDGILVASSARWAITHEEPENRGPEGPSYSLLRTQSYKRVGLHIAMAVQSRAGFDPIGWSLDAIQRLVPAAYLGDYAWVDACRVLKRAGGMLHLLPGVERDYPMDGGVRTLFRQVTKNTQSGSFDYRTLRVQNAILDLCVGLDFEKASRWTANRCAEAVSIAWAPCHQRGDPPVLLTVPERTAARDWAMGSLACAALGTETIRFLEGH